MLLIIACLFATAAAKSVSYDQSQTGKFNGQLDISNVMFLFALPSKIPASLFEFFAKGDRTFDDNNQSIQNRADIPVIEAFVEPSKPYRVEIGSDAVSGESDGRAAEVVIVGRRRLGTDLPDAEQDSHDELKLLGATENCGPDRVRDSVTLMCKDEPKVQKETEKKEEISEVKPAPAPEVIAL